MTMPTEAAELTVTAGMRPLLIRADLAHGVGLDSRWGTALDGLLASVMWGEHKAALHERGQPTPALVDLVDPPDMPLPLARCVDPGTGDWHWASTWALPQAWARDDIEVRRWTTKLDHRHAEQASARLPKTLPAHQGRYRSRNMPTVVTVCDALLWQAVGDQGQIEDLVAQLDAIGKKRAHGEGRVLRWSVEAAPHLSLWHAGHLRPDGGLGRPSFLSCMAHLPPATQTGGRGTAAIRAPHIHQSRLRQVYLPKPLGE